MTHTILTHLLDNILTTILTNLCMFVDIFRASVHDAHNTDSFVGMHDTHNTDYNTDSFVRIYRYIPREYA